MRATPRDERSFDERVAESLKLRDSLAHHIGLWIEANCDDNPYWAEAWFAPQTEGRMAEAAWQIFMSSRDGQRFAKEQK